MTQQYLRGGHTVRAKMLFIGAHERGLPNRRGGLGQMHFMGTLCEIQAREARHNRTAGHQHDIAAP